MVTATTLELASGGHVHFRRTQMLLWSVVAAVLGAGFIAGLYYLVLEMHWYVHIGALHWNGFTLKNWWDNLSSSPNWATYRHTAFRDIPESAFATMGVLTLLVKPKWWETKVGTLRLATAPVVLILSTFAMGLAGTWLLHFGLPEGARTFLAHGQAGNLILGFLIGRILHRFWAPVGATIQSKLLGRTVTASYRRKSIPVWVRYPLTPPVVRERFSKIYTESVAWRETLVKKTKRNLAYWYLTALTTGFTVVTVVGLVAHYWIGKGHNVPYLAP